jgi:hypothetical protein
MQWRLGLKAHPYVSISFCETHVRVHPPTHSPHPTHSLTPHIHHTLLLSHTFSLPRYLIHIVARTPALHRYMVRGDRSAITPILRRLGKWYSNVWGSVDGGIFAQCYDEDETNCPSYVDTALYLRSSTAGVLCAVLPPPPLHPQASKTPPKPLATIRPHCSILSVAQVREQAVLREGRLRRVDEDQLQIFVQPLQRSIRRPYADGVSRATHCHCCAAHLVRSTCAVLSRAVSYSY